MEKILSLLIAFAMIGLTVVPQIQAQTAAQQKELEEIAKRSMNGLSAKDRQRVIQIMTDVYVKQGMPKQQASQLAEMGADSMFSTDVGEMSADERRQFEEQNQAIDAFEQSQRPQPPNNRWPPAQAFSRYGKTIQKPAVNFNGEFEQNGDELTISIRSPGYYEFKGFTQAEITAICRAFETVFGAVYPAEHYDAGKNWRNDVVRGNTVTIRKPDPKHKNTAKMRYWIELEIIPGQSAGQILGFTIKMSTDSGAIEDVQ